MKLSDYAPGRDNNFNLLRIVAALAVLFSHSFALTAGSKDAEPLRDSLGMSCGSIAVDLFFVTSGFLVTGSLLARNSLIDFAWARVLRIYPALLVMLAITVFGIGLAFTTLPAAAYLAHKDVYRYLLKNGVLLFGARYELPGVFDDNPYRSAINGSLWSMPVEMRMYVLLALVFALARVAFRSRPEVFRFAILGVVVVSGAWQAAAHFPSGADEVDKSLLFLFFSGAAYRVLESRITMSRGVFWSCVLALGLSIGHPRLLFVTYHLLVPYLLFYICFVPGGAIRAFNRVGDYSYGVYIYAFPVQQTIVALVPRISAISLFLSASAVTLGLAALSWHLVEKHALALKGACVDSTRRRLARTP